MSKPFKGVINIDVRDSVPDWEPFQQPKAPEDKHRSITRAAERYVARIAASR